jgi:tRNA A37 threonylcarbamoyladenosine modification protein TsaB
MLFIHLSREKILLMGEEFLEELLYVDIERKLPPLLIDTLEEHNIDEIFVLNGPGSFTTLRL